MNAANAEDDPVRPPRANAPESHTVRREDPLKRRTSIAGGSGGAHLLRFVEIRTRPRSRKEESGGTGALRQTDVGGFLFVRDAVD